MKIDICGEHQRDFVGELQEMGKSRFLWRLNEGIFGSA